MKNRYQYLLRLQRRYRNLQKRWAATQDRKLAHKLDMIKRRLHRLNRKWSLGVSAAALTLWLAAMPAGTVQAQRFTPTVELADLDGSDGVKLLGEAELDRSGFSVSSAGDVNGDGVDDLLIGAFGADEDTGTTYVVFGNAAGFPASMELSSLDGSNGFKLLGEAANDDSGRSVSSAGDVNGDGVDDLLIGARGADPNDNNSGTTYVVFGSAAGFPASMELSGLDGSDGVKLLGASDDDSGHSVSSAGDVNGDGVDDLLIGAPFADENDNNSGTTYVVFGTAAGFPASVALAELDGSDGFKLLGEAEDDRSGRSVSTAGDVNGDGVDDLLIGAYGADENGSFSGTTYVVFGSAAGFSASVALAELDGSDGFRLFGEFASDFSGFSVSTAGDVNGDGLDDLLIGAYRADEATGATYVVFGRAAGFPASVALSSLDGGDGVKLLGEAEGDRSGTSVSTAGDVNGDGVDDLLIGAYGADENGSFSGTTYVVFGSAAGFPASVELADLDGSDGFKVLGEAAGDGSGFSVSSAGDVNGDGVDDLLIGAPYAEENGSFSGTTYVVFGRDVFLAPEVATALASATALEGVAFSYSIPAETFSDPDDDLAPVLSASLSDGSSLPEWLSFETDTFSGTPAVADVGSYTILVTATDQDGLSVSTELLLTVDGAPLLATALPNLEAAKGTAFFYQVPEGTFSDPEGFDVTFSAAQADGSALPDWLTFTSSGIFIGTPATEDIGTYTLTVTATDPQGLSFTGNEFTLEVKDELLVTVPLVDTESITGIPFSYQVPSGTFAAPDNAALTLAATQADGSELPAWLSFDGTAFSGTPTTADVGSITVSVTATSEAGTSISDEFVITVKGVPFAAAALTDATATEGEAFSYEVAATTFTDPEGGALTLTATLSDGSALPAWLSFDGTTFSGTPATADVGSITISVTATDDDGLSVSDLFTLEVLAAADDDGDDGSGDDGNGDDSGDDGDGDGETPLSVGDAEVPSLVFYPNPTQGVLTLESEQPVVAQLTDMHGRTLSAQLTGTVLTFDMSGLKSGVYFLVIAEGTEVHTHKIVKQ